MRLITASTFKEVLFDLLSITFCLFLLSACSLTDDDDDDDKPAEEQTNIPQTPASNPTLTLVVVDENRNSLSDATVSSESYTLTQQTYDSNNRLIVELEASTEPGMLHIQKTGYLTAMLYKDGLLADSLHTVTLKQRQAITITDPMSDGEFNAEDGAAVSLSGNSLIREDGQPIVGDLQLFITPIDVSDTTELAAFPGSFLGLASADTEPGNLMSFGVSIIDIENNGVAMQLRDGQTAEVVIPLYAATHIDGSAIEIGDQIPFWILNESSGIWEEESTGSVISLPLSPTGLGLRATTTHFSAFNADIWGGRLSNQNGPNGSGSGVSTTPSDWCRVFMTITDMDDNQEFGLRIEQLISAGRPVFSQPRNGRYSTNTPIEFSLLRNRGALISVWEHGSTRSLRQGFRCESESTNLAVSFNQAPNFTNWFISNKPVFEVLNPGGGYEIVSNEIHLGNSFVGDSDNTAEVTSNLGVVFNVANGVDAVQNFLPTDPDPASFSAYLENDAGETAQRVDSTQYISSQAPIIQFVRVNFDENGPVFEWSVEGADTVDILHYGSTLPDVGLLGFAIITDLFADTGSYSLGLTGQGANGYFELTFENQYGTSKEVVDVICVDQPNADLPPCQVAQ